MLQILINLLIPCVATGSLAGGSGHPGEGFGCDDAASFDTPVDSLGPHKMDEWIANQPALDAANWRYAPRLRTNFEVAGCNIGRIIIGDDALGNGVSSVIFGSESHSQFVVKYQVHLDSTERDGLDSLVKDFMFGRIAAKIGVGARPVFISPSARILSPDSPKLRLFFQPPFTPRDIERARRLWIRYMVMERMGDCLGDSATPPPLPPVQAVQIGIDLMKLVERLHAAGVVHGDIHGGNVCRRLTNPDEIALIDFETAFFPHSPETVVQERGRLEWVHASLTPWQLEGYSFARRDDVYKAFYLVAKLMVGPRLTDRFKVEGSSALLDGEALLEWKRNGPLFETPEFDPIAMLAESDSVKGGLNRIHAMVMDLTDVSVPIRYDRIVAGLETVQKLILTEAK